MEIKFPDNMNKVIIHSFTSVETNVKWNGARAEFFRPQRCIRQRDPISPYLFVFKWISYCILQCRQYWMMSGKCCVLVKMVC